MLETVRSSATHTYTHSWLPATSKQTLCWDDCYSQALTSENSWYHALVLIPSMLHPQVIYSGTPPCGHPWNKDIHCNTDTACSLEPILRVLNNPWNKGTPLIKTLRVGLQDICIRGIPLCAQLASSPGPSHCCTSWERAWYATSRFTSRLMNIGGVNQNLLSK